MTSHTTSSRRMTRIAFGIAALTIFSALAFARVGFRAPEPIAPPTPAPVLAAVQGDELNAVLIHVSRFGFDPYELTLDAGPKRLVIINDTGIDDLSFTITKPGPDAGVVVDRERLGGVDLDLTPGLTVITEASHPDWRCEITIAS